MFHERHRKGHAHRTRRLGLTGLSLLALAVLTACDRDGAAPDPGPEVPPDPVVVPHALAPADMAFVSQLEHWAEAVAQVEGLGSERTVNVPAFGEDGRAAAGSFSPWTTDEWLLARKAGKTIAFDLPGDCGLSGWAADFFSKKSGTFDKTLLPFASEDDARFCQGGALMASPPVPGHPDGLLLVSRQMDDRLKAFFRQQRTQTDESGDLLEVDTGWLKVGHVDEIIAFVPSDNEKGFRLAVADPTGALNLLNAVPPDRACFVQPGSAEASGAVLASETRTVRLEHALDPKKEWRWLRVWSGTGAGQTAHIRAVNGDRVQIDNVWNMRDAGTPSASKGLCRALSRRDCMPIWFERPDRSSRIVAVESCFEWIDAANDPVPALLAAGEMQKDRFLRTTAREAGERIRLAEKLVRKALHLKEADTVRLPVLFASPENRLAEVFALTPNTVNLVVFNGRVITLAPHLARKDANDDRSDVFLQATLRALPFARGRLSLIEGWDAVHRLNGGARCGINVLRR